MTCGEGGLALTQSEGSRLPGAQEWLSRLLGTNGSTASPAVSDRLACATVAGTLIAEIIPRRWS
jgi:hypothetical protein